jgi:hypothetical protein
MSKVVIQGHASGTGDFTIAAPNSDTDRTLTLPDTDGTLVTGDDITINGITSNYTSGTALNVDSNGIVTKSNQPAFFARLTTGSDQTNLVLGSAVVVEMDEEVYDVGNNYNPSTYNFTAPVTGKYVLSAGIRIDSVQTSSSYYRLEIHSSNAIYYQILDPNFSGNLAYLTRDMCVVADMDSGDTANVRLRQQSGTLSHIHSTNDYSWFSGYLLG